MPRPNPFSRKPNDDQSPETMMFPTDDTQMMDEPVPANADGGAKPSSIIFY